MVGDRIAIVVSLSREAKDCRRVNFILLFILTPIYYLLYKHSMFPRRSIKSISREAKNCASIKKYYTYASASLISTG